MLTEFFSKKILSLATHQGSIGISTEQNGDSSTWGCQLIPTDFSGSIMELVTWLVGDKNTAELKPLFEGLDKGLAPLIKVQGSTLTIASVVELTVEKLSLQIKKLPAQANPNPTSSNSTDVSHRELMLAFRGGLGLFGSFTVVGDLLIRLHTGKSPEVQFVVDASSQPSSITVPLLVYEHDLVITPRLEVLDVVDVNGGVALIGRGQVGLQGGPEWLDTLLPDNTAIEFRLASTADLSGKLSWTASLVIPQVMDNMQVPLPDFPFLVNGPGDNQGLGALNLSLKNLGINIELNHPDRPFLTIEVGVGLPQAVNYLLGSKGGKPLFELFNTFDSANPDQSRVKARFTIDKELVQFQLLTSPIKGITTIPAAGSQNKTLWVLDLGESGLLHIQPPVFAQSPTSQAMAASGGFEIKRPIRIDLTLIKEWINANLFDGAASLLPNHLAIKDINVLNGNTLNTNALAQLWGAEVPSAIQSALSVLNSVVAYLPERLKHFLAFEVPNKLFYDFRVDAKGSCTGAIKTSAQRPLKLLIPNGVSLIGIELRQFGLGQLSAGKLGLLQLDATFDLFLLPEIAASMLASSTKVPLLPNSKNLITQLDVRKLLATIAYQTGSVTPIFYDRLSLHRLGAEGLTVSSELRLPKPTPTALELLQFFSEIIGFVTQKKRLLDPSQPPGDIDIEFTIGPNYLQLPDYLGGQRLGAKKDVVSLSAWPYLAPALNFLKTGRVDQFVQSFPIQYRCGSQRVNFLSLIDISVDYLITSPREFTDGAYNKLKLTKSDSHEVLKLLPDITTAESNSLITLLRGEFSIGPATFTNTYAFTGGVGGVSMGFQISGDLANNLVSMNLSGFISVNETGLKLLGETKLRLLGKAVMFGKVALKNDELYISGTLNLFPNNGFLTANTAVEGNISSESVKIAGQTDLSVAGKSLIQQGALLLSHDILSISGKFLGIHTVIEVKEKNNTINLLGYLSINHDFSISTGDIKADDITVFESQTLKFGANINLTIEISSNHFLLKGTVEFYALDVNFNINVKIEFVPSDLESLISSLTKFIKDAIIEYLIDLLKNPDQLVKLIGGALISMTGKGAALIADILLSNGYSATSVIELMKSAGIDDLVSLGSGLWGNAKIQVSSALNAKGSIAPVCVDGADVLITPPSGYIFTKITDKIRGGAQQKLLCSGKPALTIEDIVQWAKSYFTLYIKFPFTMGLLRVSSIQVQPLAAKTTVTNKHVVFTDTTITVHLSFIIPALLRTPYGIIPDFFPPPPMKVKFISSGQQKLNSV